MIVVVIVLAVVAASLLAVVLTTARRLRAQRTLTTAADERAQARATELAAAIEARDDTARRLAEADARATAADTRRAEVEDQVRVAEATATEMERRAEAAEAERDDARREAAASASSVDGQLDARVVWALEQARTERTWRHSVAVDPEDSAFPRSSDPLHDALQVELEAAREDVGAYVELDVELPDHVTPAGALLTLRAAQELLATVVRRSESTTLQVRVDGADLLVDVHAVDEKGTQIEPGRLPTPPSPAFETTTTGVRIRNAVEGPAAD